MWMFALRRCASEIVWGTYIFGGLAVASFVFYGVVKLNTPITSVEIWGPSLGLVVYIIVIIWKREAINRGARVMATACKALEENPCLFTLLAVLQLLQLAYFAWFICATVGSYFAYVVTSTAMNPSDPGSVDN